MWMMDEKSFVGTHYRSDEFNSRAVQPLHHHPRPFDKWFSEKVQEAGALVICEMTVKALLRNDAGRVIGVEVEREDGKIYADAVILADGVNSLAPPRPACARTSRPERGPGGQGDDFPAARDGRGALQPPDRPAWSSKCSAASPKAWSVPASCTRTRIRWRSASAACWAT
jgi:hypothetical protein